MREREAELRSPRVARGSPRRQPRQGSLNRPSRRPYRPRSVEKHFRWLVLLLCGAYFGVQARYIAGLPLVMDEFANAGHIFRLDDALPYRDYLPYKTVVGYYLLLPALSGFDSAWHAMLAVKLEIAAVTACVLGLVACRLRRHFASPAILGALLLLCTQSTFLERASELRVDMLAALFGLISLVAFLERRGALAGVAAGFSVLATQKGAYFVVALGAALAFQVLYCSQRRQARELASALAAGAAVLLGYVGFWCSVGEPARVWQSMFLGPRRIAFEQLYSIDRYWSQTLERNPVFYALPLAGLFLLLPHWKERADSVGARLWSYSLSLAALCAWHKQPWPYFFVLLIPTAWVLSAAVLHRGLREWPRGWRLALAVLVVGGASASAALRVPVVSARSSLAQRRVVEAASAFLKPGETYLAGTELLWRQPHINHLSWLDNVRLQDIRRAPETALEELRARPPRLVIDNYRIRSLPVSLLEELIASFAPVGGNLLTYAPRLPSGESQRHFAYGGSYVVRTPAGGGLSLDGGPWLADGARVELSVGTHHTRASAGARLISISDEPAFRAQMQQPHVNLFDRVYDY